MPVFFFYLQHFAFYFSSFSSSSGSAPWQPRPSAAAWPWSSRCHQNSDWGWPGGGRGSRVRASLVSRPWVKHREGEEGGWGDVTTSLSARRKDTSGSPFRALAAGGERRGLSGSIFIPGPCCLLHLEFLPRFLTPETHPLLQTQTHTKQSLCSRAFNFKYLCVSLLPLLLPLSSSLISPNTFTANFNLTHYSHKKATLCFSPLGPG